MAFMKNIKDFYKEKLYPRPKKSEFKNWKNICM